METITKRDSMDASLEDVKTHLEHTRLTDKPPEKKIVGLVDLPASVRNNIYKYCLDTELVNVGKPNVSYKHTIKDGVLQFKASRPPFPVETALFYVNQQISREALQCFYSSNLFVRLEICTPDARHAKTMLEESGLLFTTSSASAVGTCKRHAMDLTIVEKNSSHTRAKVIFPAQYLPRLINFLDQASRTTNSWAQTHSLFINVLNTYDFSISRLQGDLLELFRLLTDFGAVTVEGEALLAGYANGLAENMLAATFTADAWRKTVTAMAHSGDEAFECGKYTIAKEQYQTAIVSMTYGYLTRAEFLHSQPEDFTKSMQRLRWRCEIGTGKALCKQHSSSASNPISASAAKKQMVAKDLLLAETSVSRALSLATDSLSPTSNPWFQTLPAELIPPNNALWFSKTNVAKSWLECGRAHMAIGECLFAAGDLERATQMVQEIGDEDKSLRDEVKKAFEQARESIDWNARPGWALKRAARVARGEVV